MAGEKTLGFISERESNQDQGEGVVIKNCRVTRGQLKFSRC